jgi:hypothetical protein
MAETYLGYLPGSFSHQAGDVIVPVQTGHSTSIPLQPAEGRIDPTGPPAAPTPIELLYAEGGSAVVTESGKTRGEILVRRALAAGIDLPEGMIAAIPTEKEYVAPYMIGALAAAKRRAHPVAAITPYAATSPLSPSSEGKRVLVEDLPTISAPIVEIIRATRPSLVMAADRGGRFFGLGIFATWRKRYPGVPFPTADGRLHFAHISKSAGREYVLKTIATTMMRSGLYAEMMQRRAEQNNSPVNVMVLDDWILWGGTVELAIAGLEMRDKFALNENFTYTHATVAGDCCAFLPGAPQTRHLIGDTTKNSAFWNNQDEIIGVAYHTHMNSLDYQEKFGPHSKQSPLARSYRRQLQKAVTGRYAIHASQYITER